MLNTTVLGATGCAGIRLSEGGHCYHHYPYHSLVWGQTTEREHSPTLQEKIGLKIYWAWPCPSEQDRFPPIRKLPQASYHYPSEGRQNEKYNHRKLSNWSHGSQPCLTQWNYEPGHVGPPRMDCGAELWQNMVHWRREWKTTSEFFQSCGHCWVFQICWHVNSIIFRI